MKRKDDFIYAEVLDFVFAEGADLGDLPLSALVERYGSPPSVSSLPSYNCMRYGTRA